MDCPECSGHGVGTNGIECPSCGGTGVEYDPSEADTLAEWNADYLDV